MNEELLQSLGPPPFRFIPTQAGLSGPAFTLPFKALATVIVAAGSAWLASLWRAGALGSGSSTGLVWLLTALALMLYTWWHIMRSRTRLDAGALHQTWVWDKQLELRELAYGKLIRVRGLDWLIAPRLYARTLMGKFAVFYAADPVLLADFERLVREVAEFRKM
ncbi:hypothetical protein GCM10027399_00750 [Curvibacter fontanus]|jgi:hypothetical protein